MPPLKIREMPQEERPREKLAAHGASTLTNPELIAILLRTGVVGTNAIEVARELLDTYGSLTGLSRCNVDELAKIRGVGFAKAVQLVAAFGLGQRLARETLSKQKIDSPELVNELIGREMRMLVEGADDQTAADPSLLRVIARAHDLQGRLSQNTDLTVHDIAREERVSAAYIYTLLRLPWLAPDITTAIVNGRQPQQLSAKTLMRKASRLPADWTEQRTLLGF